MIVKAAYNIFKSPPFIKTTSKTTALFLSRAFQSSFLLSDWAVSVAMRALTQSNLGADALHSPAE